MGGAIAKFTHPFNGPMQYAQYTTRGTREPGEVQFYTRNRLYQWSLSFMDYKADAGRNTYRVNPQVGTGPPIPGKASVDGLGNLSFKGGGYTYVMRMPNDGETGYSSSTMSIPNIYSIDANSAKIYTDYPEKEKSIYYDYFIDKNMGVGYYLHVNEKLKKGKDWIFITNKYDGSYYTYAFANWYDA